MPIAQPIRVNARTLGMEIQQNGSPKWIQFNVSYKNFASASSPADFDIAGFPRGTMINGACVRNRQNWTGGSVSAATLSVGSTGAPTAYVAATSVFSGAPATLAGVALAPGTFLATSSPASLRVRLTTTTDTPDHLTAGYADVFILLSNVQMFFNG